jgi:ADP-ribose pyrophosphatase YjhB (NUDIX family)
MSKSKPTASAQDLQRWAQSLAGIARTGLAFTESSYEIERYHEILEVAGDIQAATEGVGTAAHFREEWLKTVGSGIPGYVTPKVAIGAIVGDDQGRILLIQRSDSGVWLYPTGWADIGYSPAEVAMKEVQEETGIECEVVRPLGIHDGMRLGFTKRALYSLTFYCRATGGELAPHPQECLDAGWFARDELPEATVGVERWGDMAFAAIAGEEHPTFFDEPRNPVWRKPNVKP